MPWSYKDYPTSMKNLTSEVRHKAIDIANALLDEGYNEGRAIAIATAQAEKWAAHRNKPIRKDNASGSTGQAVASDNGNGHVIHVMPNPRDDGWIAKQGQKQIAQGKQKEDVIDKARERAKSQNTHLCIHDDSGDVASEEDYS